jgi:hypothetical protein
MRLALAHVGDGPAPTGKFSLRTVGHLTALGVASALLYALGLAAAITLGSMVSTTMARSSRPALAAPAPRVASAQGKNVIRHGAATLPRCIDAKDSSCH